MKKTNKRVALKSENIRNLNASSLALAIGGGRTQGSVVVNDCALQCTQSCDQCSMWPQCPTETSTSTF